MMDRGAQILLDDLRKYPDAGGYGRSPQAFATSYLKVGNRFLEVWARSVVSIGGAAVGFTATANAYGQAEAANDATGKTKAVVQPLPKVIENLFVHWLSILGISRNRLRHLITQKESRKFGKDFSPWIDKYCVYGDAEMCRQQLKSFLDAGVQHLGLGMIHSASVALACARVSLSALLSRTCTGRSRGPIQSSNR